MMLPQLIELASLAEHDAVRCDELRVRLRDVLTPDDFYALHTIALGLRQMARELRKAVQVEEMLAIVGTALRAKGAA